MNELDLKDILYKIIVVALVVILVLRIRLYLLLSYFSDFFYFFLLLYILAFSGVITRKQYGGMVTMITSMLEGLLYYSVFGYEEFLQYNLILIIIGFINWLDAKNLDDSFSPKYAIKKRTNSHHPTNTSKTVVHVDQEHLKAKAIESFHNICPNCKNEVESKVNYCKSCGEYFD
jgi:hypothetical protein